MNYVYFREKDIIANVNVFSGVFLIRIFNYRYICYLISFLLCEWIVYDETDQFIIYICLKFHNRYSHEADDDAYKRIEQELSLKTTPAVNVRLID